MDENPPAKQHFDGFAHTTAKALLSLIPVVGGTAAEYFAFFIASPVEKRRDQWLESVLHGLAELEERFKEFETGKIFESESFISVFLQATRYALIQHNQENLHALRNAVLNASLSVHPDDIREKMFVEWAGELTAWHIRLLRLFDENKGSIPSLNLDDPDWQLNIANQDLAELIESKYPDMKNNYQLYLQIVKDLHQRNLLTHKVPGRNTLSRIEHRPILSTTAEEFLTFIRSPIAD